jgi:hypothetical protein
MNLLPETTRDTTEAIKVYVACRYGHLSPKVQEEILQAYLASSKRKKGALLEERGCDVCTDLSSTNYKNA